MRADHFSTDVQTLIALFEDGRQVPLPVLGLAELERNKRASGRHKDLDDVEHLEPVLARSSKK